MNYKYTKEDMIEIEKLAHKQGVRDTIENIIFFIIGFAMLYVISLIVVSI